MYKKRNGGRVVGTGRHKGGPYVCVSLVAWRVFQDPKVFRTSIPQ